jgi:alanyl-tRNA synthetase
MQYIKNTDGTFGLLPKQNVDFGGGLERIAAVRKGESDVFNIDVFDRPKEVISNFCGVKYHEEGGPNGIVVAKSGGMPFSDMRYTYRVILDHVRAATFLIGDGVLPSNKDQGYFVRRLIRRAVRYGHKLGIDSNFTAEVAKGFIGSYSNAYPELRIKIDFIVSELTQEEERFRITLARGVKEMERFIGDAVFDKEGLNAKNVFQLVTTFGFPLELILEEAGERGIKQIDIEGFKELLKGHQDLSRAGSEQKFKGGLADTSDKTVRLHTAHHLLLKALQQVLGPEVHQRGSNITGERLRIDFNYGAKMTPEQKREVENIVNEKIKENLPVVRTEMTLADAEKLHAEHEFGAKYPERVSVYSMGPLDNAFSIEFCGGPHVEHTGQLSESGVFKIQKEEAVAQGIRRIKAVLQ